MASRHASRPTPPPSREGAHANANTALAVRRYDRSARSYDSREAVLEPLFARWRRRLWADVPARSRVLEIGVGTGKNIRFYPAEASVLAFDFSPAMLSRTIVRLRRADGCADLALMDAQAIACREEIFDVAVATFVFCSVPDPVRGLMEVRRVLRPGGRLLLLEHVKSGLPVLGKVMDLINPLALRASGANINRDTVGNVRQAGFRVLQVSNLFLDIVKLIVAEKPADADALIVAARD